MAHKQTRKQLVDQHMKHVYAMAVRLYRQLGRRVELGDLVAFGTEGLLEAADRFDSERGVGFGTFAFYRIKGAMMDGVRKLMPMSAAIYQQERDRRGRWEMHVTRSRAGSEERPVDESVATAELCGRVRHALGRLSARERNLIEDHYYEERKLCDIGATMGVSKSWASRLHARAIDNLRDELAVAA